MLLGGVLVAYLEFLRPGLVVPGVAGGVAAIWGLSRLVAIGLNWLPASLLVVGALLLVMEARARNRTGRSSGWGVAGLITMLWSSEHLVRVSLVGYAAEIGVAIFAVVTVPLLAVAFRARKNKASYQ
jgi:membrane-bound ClpP family serine protease